MPTPRLISSHWPFWLWDRQHILAPVMEDEHTTTVASSSDVSFVYPRSLSRATSVEPRNHHETRVSRLWTSSTSAARDSTTASIRRASMSRLYWLFSLQSGRSPQEAHRNADVRQLLVIFLMQFSTYAHLSARFRGWTNLWFKISFFLNCPL